MSVDAQSAHQTGERYGPPHRISQEFRNAHAVATDPGENKNLSDRQLSQEAQLFQVTIRSNHAETIPYPNQAQHVAALGRFHPTVRCRRGQLGAGAGAGAGAVMVTSKRKRYGGHWIMRDDEKIGEAWKMKGHNEFGMTIGGHFTKLPRVCWRYERPSAWGFAVISARRLVDVVAIAEKHFGRDDVCQIA